MKARILLLLLLVFFIKTTAFSQFTGGVQDGYASGSSVKKVIADSIMTMPLSGSTFCAGAAINVDFFAVTFTAGNTFTAQLSNAAGSFAAPVILGTLVGTTSGTIACTIPILTPGGIGYKVRVVSSSPFYTSQPSSTTVTINAAPVVSASSNSPVCVPHQ